MPHPKGSIPWNKGKKLSTEHKNKIGLAHKNKEHTLEHRTNVSNGLKKAYLLGTKKATVTRGKDHANWKGEKVTYCALHVWVRKYLGKPKKCQNCDKLNSSAIDGRSKIQWANIDHSYRRNLKDYIPLCITCHREYDKQLITI